MQIVTARVGAFKDIGPRNKPSGFEENLGYGLGVNQLTPGQKNVLIFGGFALATRLGADAPPSSVSYGSEKAHPSAAVFGD